MGSIAKSSDMKYSHCVCTDLFPGCGDTWSSLVDQIVVEWGVLEVFSRTVLTSAPCVLFCQAVLEAKHK